ncbi:MAG: cyclase family protein [Candidatus Omnitrophota bacterium]
MKIIDLSVSLENNGKCAPWWGKNRIKYQDHRIGCIAILLLYKLTPKYLRQGLGWANEYVSLSTHGTTHLDAPWHFAPTSEGNPAKSIDEIPLEWCYGNGVVLNMTHKKMGESVTIDDVKKELERVEYRIKPLDIVLIHTGCDKRLRAKEYFYQGIGVSEKATKWILDQGVKVTGIDAWGWDAPLAEQAKLAKQTRTKNLFWASHFVGIEREYCHLERLTNLDKLPVTGFKIACFPLKVKKGSAGPTRAVAILEN